LRKVHLKEPKKFSEIYDKSNWSSNKYLLRYEIPFFKAYTFSTVIEKYLLVFESVDWLN